MKNIFKISIFFLLIAFLISCEEKLQTLDSSKFAVRFQTNAINLIEGGTTLEIPVTLAAPAQSSAVDIEYEVGGNAVAGVDYESLSGSLSIAPGSFSATITIDILDDFEIDGAKNIVLTLSSVSNGLNAGIGTLGKSLSVNIADNDCPFDVNEYVGAYSLTAVLANGFIFAAGTYDLDANLVLGATDNTLIDPDFGFLSESGRAPVPVTIQIDPVAQTTYTLGEDYTFGDGSSVTDAVYAYGVSPAERYFTGDGLGTLSSCAKSFVVNALIRREDGSVGQILTLTYTKKP